MCVQSCRHVKEDGVYCQCPALRGREYCYFHLRVLGRRMRLALQRSRRQPHRLVLPPLEDMNAVQVALMQVLEALAAGEIEQRTAGLMLYGLQQAATNLRSLAAAPALALPKDAVDGADEYPGFEAEFGLPPEVNLAIPPEAVFPPAEAEGGEIDAAIFHSREFRYQYFSPEDVELEELEGKQDRQAYRKRFAELNNKAWKEVRKYKGVVERARYVVEAARRNEELLSGGPGQVASMNAEVERMRQAEAAKRKPPASAGSAEKAKARVGE